jgi:tRNA(His) 5'-end guanylyltransferase
MAALASKSQSQKIFEKLRTKPANRVSMPHVSFDLRVKSLTVVRTPDMLRLRAEEPHLDISAFWHLSLPGLFFKSPKLGCSYLVCAIHES